MKAVCNYKDENVGKLLAHKMLISEKYLQKELYWEIF